MFTIPDPSNVTSLMDRLNAAKTFDAKQHGQFYSANYAIENFIKVVQDNEGGDLFNVLNDPTYAGFKLFFHFDATSGLFADEEYTDSALAYLKRIGLTEKYELLKRFINVLSKVNSITPWIFQDIEGLQEVYAEPYEEIYKMHQINIICLETIDNKIGSIAQMYKSIAYDHHSRKWILPKNLRRFSMSVFVYDYRIFNDLDPTAIDFLQTLENTDITQLNHTLFDLGYCQFNPASGSAFFDGLSNNRTDANMNNLTIDFEKYDVSGLFKSLLGLNDIGSKAMAVLASTNVNGTPPDDSFFSKRHLTEALGVDLIRQKVNDALDVDKWKSKLEATALNTAADAIQKIRGAISGLFLGNVYGFGTDDILNAGQRPLASTFSATKEIPSLRAKSNVQGGNLGNVND